MNGRVLGGYESNSIGRNTHCIGRNTHETADERETAAKDSLRNVLTSETDTATVLGAGTIPPNVGRRQMTDISYEFHEKHREDDDGMDYTCPVCVLGAVLAQVEDLDWQDRRDVLLEALRSVGLMASTPCDEAD